MSSHIMNTKNMKWNLVQILGPGIYPVMYIKQLCSSNLFALVRVWVITLEEGHHIPPNY